jgi:hypothetical protein
MTPEKMEKVVGAYRRAFNTPEGELVLQELAVFCGLAPDPDMRDIQNQLSHFAGSELSHAECAYRNGMQDLYRHIEALATEE